MNKMSVWKYSMAAKCNVWTKIPGVENISWWYILNAQFKSLNASVKKLGAENFKKSCGM